MGRTSSSPQTQTTVSQPPGYLLPYLTEGLNQSRNLYYRTPGMAPLSGASPYSSAGAANPYGDSNLGRLIAQNPNNPQFAQLVQQITGGYAGTPSGSSSISPAQAQAAASGNWGAFNNANPSNYLPPTSGFPENPVIGFSPQTQTALNMAEQRALAGSPVNTAAQDYATKVFGGGFMGSNPWLDQAFNKASGAVTNQIQSNFAGSGRNARGIDAAGFAQEGYNDLAANIYGGDYQAERARQQQLVPFAGQLAQQDYNDIGALANVGGQYEDLARERAMAPDVALDAYLARLQGFPGSSVTQSIPMERNRLAGALGGGLAGLGALGQLGLMGTPLGWGILGGSALLGGL